MQLRGWVLQDSEVELLSVPTDVRDQAQALAGETEAEWTSDRLNILIAVCDHVERYIGAIRFRGALGARDVTSVVEVAVVDATPLDVPIIPSHPRSNGITILSVKKWDDARETFTTAEYIRRPLNTIRVPDGTYEIVCSTLASEKIPSGIVEGVARMFALIEHRRPGAKSGEGGFNADGNVANLAGALIRSGCGELLRGYRLPTV